MKSIVTKSLLVFSCVLLLSCGKKEAIQEEKMIRPVRFQEVGLQSTSFSRTYTGVAKTEKEIKMSFRSSGIVTKLDIVLGQKVRKGQLLASLDNVQARLAYEQSISALHSAESQMNTAKSSLNRIRSLYESGSASLSDYEVAKNSYKTASENYESTKRSVSIQKEQITYGYLYAPSNGVIASVEVELDENVNPGQAIATLNAGEEMEIHLGLPEAVINNVSKGMTTSITFSSLDQKVFTGKISEISPSLSQSAATYPVRIKITEKTKAIKAGMSANVTFDFGDVNSKESKTIIIPSSAVGEDAKGRFVFLIEDANGVSKVKKQPVTIGKLSSDGFEIKKGLQVGQKIATAGLQTLLDNQEVRLTK